MYVAVCADGQFLQNADTCADCGPGFACPDRSLRHTCGEGTYSNSHRPTKCTACDPGTYQPRTGQSGCQTCPSGRYGTQSGMMSEHQCEECASCPLGQYRSGCGGKNPGTCADCTRPASDEFFTGSGGFDPDSCPTAKMEVLKPGCTNVKDCAAWYQGDMFAAVKFQLGAAGQDMDISYSLVPQGKPDMGECASSRKGLSTITTCGDSSQLL